MRNMRQIAISKMLMGNRSLAERKSLALDVPLYDTFYTDITTYNSTAEEPRKDFMAAFGTYDPSTGVFTMKWGHLKLDVKIYKGYTGTPITCLAGYLGLWDAIGAFGVYDEANNTFTIESALVLLEALNVVGGIQVTDVYLRT